MRYVLLLAALAFALLAGGCTSMGGPTPTPTATPAPVIVTGTPTSFYGVGGALEINILDHAMTYTSTNVTVNGSVKNPTRWNIGGYFVVRWFDKAGAVLGTTNAKIPKLGKGETYRFVVPYDGATPVAEVDHYALAPGAVDMYN